MTQSKNTKTIGVICPKKEKRRYLVQEWEIPFGCVLCILASTLYFWTLTFCELEWTHCLFILI